MSQLQPGFISGNYFDKYRTRNRLLRLFHDGFIESARKFVDGASPRSILEVGCGPGDLAACLFGRPHLRPVPYVGVDVSDEEILVARSRLPGWDFRVASIYELPFADRSFDMVVACEVFEHLDDPLAGLDEVARVCRSKLLASVPWEPIWRLSNFARGKYLTRLGNTPGHLQHFSRRRFRRLIRERFEILAEARPFPWTMCLASIAPGLSI